MKQSTIENAFLARMNEDQEVEFIEWIAKRVAVK